MTESIEPTDPTSLLTKPWQKFLTKLSDLDITKLSQWKETQLLGYICRRYETLYGQKYALSYRGAPSKCPEIHMVRKIMAMLGTTNAKIVSLYIDWVFDNKIIPKNMKIRTLGLFNVPGFGNEFKQYRSNLNKIDKTTALPPEYKQVADIMEIPVSTYGDLAFVRLALEQSPDAESRVPYKRLFNTLVTLGFETAVLDGML